MKIINTISIVIITLILSFNQYINFNDKAERKANFEKITRLTAINEVLEKERVSVFKQYIDALDSYQTKSIYHQIYHAINAQLKMQNITVQQNQLFLEIIKSIN
ncbi:MAG: hypothetical protein QMC67_05030 [Candidatus Wallbacteria bacterium]